MYNVKLKISEIPENILIVVIIMKVMNLLEKQLVFEVIRMVTVQKNEAEM